MRYESEKISNDGEKRSRGKTTKEGGNGGENQADWRASQI